MRLLSCYIENYGKIKRREYTFSGDITTFCEANGAGKTTLASFIKAMFYGLEPYRQNSKEFCDRQHFYPFDGGNFGGNLTFEMNGKIYKIERFFGEKSDTMDEVTVYSDGEVTNEFGEDIGRSVFGIDKRSFERTAFIGSEEIEISSTSSINAKLNNFLQGGEDDAGLDEACLALEKASKEYKKAKAGKDKISEEMERIAELKEKIVNAESVRAALETKYGEYDRIEARIKELSDSIVVAQKQNEVLSDWQHYEYLLSLVQENESELKRLGERYPAGVPTERETLDVKERLIQDGKYEARAEEKNFTQADEYSFARLSKTFENGVPTESEIVGAENTIKKLSALEAELELNAQRPLSDSEKRLVAKFSLRKPTEEELKKAEEKVERYRSIKRKSEEIPAYITGAGAPSQPTKPKGKGYLIVAVFAVVALLAGVGILFVERPVGVGILCLGTVVLLADAFLYLNKKSGGGNTSELTQTENPERRAIEAELRETEDVIKALLLPYGYSSENGLIFDFATLKNDVFAYETFLVGESERTKTIEEKTVQRRALAEELNVFFRKYRLEGSNYLKNLSELRSSMDEYAALIRRKAEKGAESEKLFSEMKENRAGIEAYLEKYRLSDLEIDRILEDVLAYKRAQESLLKNRENASKYKEEKGLKEKPAAERADLVVLNEELHALQKQNGVLKQDIVEDEYELERLDGYLQEKEQAEERLAEYKKKHKLLTATIEMLRDAEQKLKDKYVKPIKDKFVYYSDIIEKTLGERMVMTKNFEIRFERGGKERSEKHLSAGQRSICALCFRLALIKNMYVTQKPFLIFDDPFVNLDAVHMEKVQRVLKALSPDMQIVYFCCHESRAVKI